MYFDGSCGLETLTIGGGGLREMKDGMFCEGSIVNEKMYLHVDEHTDVF